MNRRIPELLAPAGSLEIVRIAVNAGADAVYFGGKGFNARQGAANLTAQEIREAVEYCYPRNVKTYLTLNTVVKQSEWDELCRFADEVLPLGVSGLIMQDLGAAEYVRKRFPNIELHASTQMSVHNLEGALWLREQGFRRVVLSRELPLSEVEHIVKNSGIETEIFIHGALCYSYSGQCLLSSVIGGRSGNRGRCAQPCRLPYSLNGNPAKRYYLNLKDICTIAFMKELSESGASSLKIEGRLKSAAYVAGVTGLYRKALDYYEETGKNYIPTEEDMERLSLLFNRGGFSKGYIFEKAEDMICSESPKHSGITAGKVEELRSGKMILAMKHKVEPGDTLEIRTRQTPYPSLIVKERELSGNRLIIGSLPGVRKGDEVRLLVCQSLSQEMLSRLRRRTREIEIGIRLKKGELPELEGISGEHRVSIRGKEAVKEAQTRPLTEEEVIRQMKKTGNSVFAAKSVKVDMDRDIFMPVSALNALRRELTDQLTPEAPRYTVRPVEECHLEHSMKEDPILEAVVSSEEQLEAAIGKVRRIYLREEFFKPEQMKEYKVKIRGTDTQLCLALPYITREKASQRVFSELDEWKDAGIRRVLAHHVGELTPVLERGLAAEAGIGIPVLNECSRLFLKKRGIGYTASVEMNGRELREWAYDPDCACVVYGRLPVMLTEQCPAKEAGYCHQEKELRLVDRMKEEWPMERHCQDCYNVFYSAKPIWLASRSRLLRELPAGKLRLYFLEEKGEEVRELLEQYRLAIYEGKPAGEEEIRRMAEKGCGSGHYDKGVE